MHNGKVIAVSKSHTHSFNKIVCKKISLLKGLGVEGDAHMGKTVQHLSRIAKNPNQPNLRQVHLIHTELFDELADQNFNVHAGEMGENITTLGIDLLGLPKDTILKIGSTAAIKITGLRNPCHQINSIKEGLMQVLIDKDEKGNLIRKAGIMGVVIESGEVNVDDKIIIQLPQKPYIKLDRV